MTDTARENRTSRRRDFWHSSYAWQCARTGQAFDVSATQNARGNRAILLRMKRTFMRPKSGTQPEAFYATIAKKDGTRGAIVRSMNGWPIMHRSLPQRPESEGAQCAPSSAVVRLRMQPMNARLMRWTLPQKPGPHCEPQSQSLSRRWVKEESMQTHLIRSVVARSTGQRVRRCGPDERPVHGRKQEEVGMTPTPPQAVEEAARSRARRLFDQMSQCESGAVRRRAVALLDTEPQAERQPGGRKER